MRVYNTIRWKIALLFIPVAFFSLLFHEFGHWTVGEILGNDMGITLNHAFPKSGQYIGSKDNLYMLCGGPCFTILLAIIFWGIIEKYKIIYAYPVVFFNFFLRLFGNIIKFEWQDEAKISAILEIGRYTVAIIVLVPLLLITWRASYVLKLNYKDNLVCTGASLVAVFLMILTEDLLQSFKVPE